MNHKLFTLLVLLVSTNLFAREYSCNASATGKDQSSIQEVLINFPNTELNETHNNMTISFINFDDFSTNAIRSFAIK